MYWSHAWYVSRSSIDCWQCVWVCSPLLYERNMQCCTYYGWHSPVAGVRYWDESSCQDVMTPHDAVVAAAAAAKWLHGKGVTDRFQDESNLERPPLVAIPIITSITMITDIIINTDKSCHESKLVIHHYHHQCYHIVYHIIYKLYIQHWSVHTYERYCHSKVLHTCNTVEHVCQGHICLVAPLKAHFWASVNDTAT